MAISTIEIPLFTSFLSTEHSMPNTVVPESLERKILNVFLGLVNQ
jgi:hypothetical protein